MPWLSIIMGLLTFITNKKKGKGGTARAAALGAIAGLGTYYVTHETDWGKLNFGALDGVETPGEIQGPPNVTNNGDGTVKVVEADGRTWTGLIGADGTTITPVNGGGPGVRVTDTGLINLLREWGPLGTSLVAGSGIAALTGNKTFLWIAGGIALVLLMR